MALDFPTSPALNQIYTSSGYSWQWNGSAWNVYSSTALVSTLNGLTGSITVASGTAIGVATTAGTITVNNTGVQTFNGLTGTVTGVTTGTANTFVPVQTFSGGINATGATLTSPVYISGLGIPTTDTQAANKAYVDSVASVGIHYHDAVVLASTDSETFNTGVTYNNGTSGVGATLRKTASFARINIDSTNGSTGDRIMIRSAATQQWNGVYSVTNQGDGTTGWILTRTSDADNYHPYENDGLGANDYFFVTSGSSLKNNAYICNNVGGITFGTTAITFAIFSTPPVYTAGTGLALNSLQFSNTGVLSVNGSTGAVTGVSSIRGLTGAVGLTNGNGIDLSVSGNTLTVSNSGVLSFNGLTGAVTGVTTGTTNTFGPLQSFTSGISAAGATFSGNIAVNGGDITTTSATATLYNTTATTVNIGNAASTVNLMGATANTRTGIGSQCYVKTGQTTTTTTAKQEIFRYNNDAGAIADTYFADIIITANYGNVVLGSIGSQITKMLVTTSYNTAINHTEYGNVNTGGNLAVYTAEIFGNAVLIYATPTNGFSTVFNVYATLMKGTYGSGE